MKTLVTDHPISRIKSVKPSLLLFCCCIFLSLSSYAEYHFIFDSETGKMEVWITGEEQYNFGVSSAGGLGINGTCTGILADQITELIIKGDSASNKIDLRGMKKSDFPHLYTESGELLARTTVYGNDGDDEIYGHDLGNSIIGGDGNDILKGGDRHDYIDGQNGKDFLFGEGGNDDLWGGQDDDYLEGGDEEDLILSGTGDDVVVGDDKDLYIYAGSGDDHVVILDAAGESQKSVYKDLAYEVNLDESSHLFISDSSGIDTLDFSLFNEGIVLDLDLFDTLQIYTGSEDTLALYGIFESFIGTEFDDVISIDPDPDVPRYVDGGSSTVGDTLYVDGMGEVTSDDGHTITIQGFQHVSYVNIEHCVMTNVSTVGLDANMDNPDENRLLQNYPNPFNSTTIIRFTVKETCSIKLNIYDIQGRLVKNIADREYTKGYYEITFSGEELSSGIYYCHFQGRGFTDIKKMVLLE